MQTYNFLRTSGPIEPQVEPTNEPTSGKFCRIATNEAKDVYCLQFVYIYIYRDVCVCVKLHVQIIRNFLNSK